jgi:hypothetical protein
MELVAILIVLAFGALGVFIWRQSRARGRWGVGPLAATCPRCGTSLPAIRKPTSINEGLWGGWTCPNCGCKVDKYGRERAA